MKMGKLVCAVALCLAVNARSAAPASLSAFSWNIPEAADVYGLHFSPVSFVGPNRVVGLSIGVANSLVCQEVSGIQLAGLISYVVSPYRPTTVNGFQFAGLTSGCDRFFGVQMAGIFSGTDEGTGLQLSGLFSGVGELMRGVQIALICAADRCRGVQFALYNSSVSMYGVQIGLLNFAAPSEDGWVVQVGLVNGIRKDKNAGWIDGMRYLPLINVGW